MATTLFKQVNYDLGSLMNYIDIGDIGLPDIQRPFVWSNAKVRDLFDSMYRGYPVGYLLFWENALQTTVRTIGAEKKQKSPRLLVVDGQQRLTSLYAVIKGIAVLRDNFKREPIEIAFNPISQRFEVADAAIRRDKAFIPSISRVWQSGIFELADDYLANVDAEQQMTAEERRRIQNAISRLHDLTSFSFTALELAASVDEEQVSEVFVRINSQGKTLNQADFILTLMSVFWEQGRRDLESFCHAARTPTKGAPSPFNYYLDPDPDQLLRVSVGLGFKRARLQHVYSILRGKDLETGELCPERRDRQFEVLRDAQSKTLNLAYWHDFFKALLAAGYRGASMISSRTGLIYAYMFYLAGRTQFGVDPALLRSTIAQWYFMTSLTGRYSSSPESSAEFDLARLRGVGSADEFVAALRQVCASTFTNDFWQITLPSELANSAARSPAQNAFFAALNILDAPVLFSDLRIRDLLDPSTHGSRAALERHHLFPKAHLQRQGIAQRRETNQIANYALLEWGDNAKASDMAPPDYVPLLSARFSPQQLDTMYRLHALPDGWWDMDYGAFLQRRRELMAGIIREAYQQIATDAVPVAADASLFELVQQGEGAMVEFKSTLRTNLHTQAHDPRIELAVLKSIAAFLNSRGGTLVIGVADDGSPIGIDADGFGCEDKMDLHLASLVRTRIGAQFSPYIHPRFEDYQDHRVMKVECWPARSPVYVKDGAVDRLYVRTGASTSELTASQVQGFVQQRFG